MYGDKNLRTPKLSPMADDAITGGGIGGLASLVYICVLCAHPVCLHANFIESKMHVVVTTNLKSYVLLQSLLYPVLNTKVAMARNDFRLIFSTIYNQ